MVAAGAQGTDEAEAKARGMTANDAVVSVRDLDVMFRRGGRDLHAVRGVSFDVMPGEIVGVVGESGSGKSVLGLSLLGLLPRDPAPVVGGSAVVCGVDMVSASAEERRVVRKRNLGAVFQDPMTSLNPTMRVGKQIVEAAGSKAEAMRLLDAVGIPEPARRFTQYPHELSGGLRQRVMIALAIAGNPQLVIADEPTTALDVTVQAQILALLRELASELHCAFVFVTHDLGVASQLADHIAVMYGGRIAEFGDSESVLHRPAHPYTVGLLESRLTLRTDREHQLPTLPGEPPDPRAHPPGCAFAPRCALREDGCVAGPPALRPAGSHDGLAACIRLGEHRRLAMTAPAPNWPRQETTLADYGSPSDSALVIKGVTKSFMLRGGRRRKKLQALRGVDLEVVRGGSVALVGESGCGKSTLLRVVAGLMKYNDGELIVGEGTRPQIVFQDAGASLTPWMTIGELIGERLHDQNIGRNARRDRVAEALNLVGLPTEVAKAKPVQLSGGQRQRAALARAIIVPPALLLCDEPTSALDVSLAATALNLIGRLRRELGMSVLFVTHDLSAARVVADRIAVMYLGRIVEFGPAEDVCSAPVHPYTRILLDSVPGPVTTHVPLSGDPASPVDPPPGCAFHPRCPVTYDDCSVTDPRAAGLTDGRTVSCLRVNDGDSKEIAIDLTAVRHSDNNTPESRRAVG
ncbi:MAG: peptide transporter ATP-binding protein [Actinomycetia bacterium]|nr:peptide transporter ATP-binding protein [Actinomycetes bacterium]